MLKMLTVVRSLASGLFLVVRRVFQEPMQVVVCGLLTALLVACPIAGAQTAIFSGAVRVVGSGFNTPYGVAVDSSGNIFVADTNNGAVKEIPITGGPVLSLGSGFTAPIGVAVDQSGNVFVTDSGSVLEILALGGYTTVNTLQTGFGNAYSLGVDGNGNVFVADQATSAVSEFSAAGGSITTVGSGFQNPLGVAVDASGNVFIADTGNNAVKEILAAGNYTTVNTVASGLNSPTGLAIDSNGNLYDTENGAVKELLATGGYSTSIPLGGGYVSPNGVAVNVSGQVFVADTYNSQVKQITIGGGNSGSAAIGSPSNIVASMWFTFTGGGSLGSLPAALTQGAAGQDFTDAGSGSCTTQGAAQVYNPGDTCSVDVTFTPTRPGVRYGAVTLSNSSGARIATGYVTGTGTGPQLNFSGTTLPITLGSGFFNPRSVSVDGSGNVFVADFYHSAVKEILAPGYTIVNSLGSGFGSPGGVAVDGGGNVFVADYSNSLIKEILAPGYTVVNTLGGGFSYPSGVAVDGSGNVFVADYSNNAVKEILAAGGYTTVNTLAGGFSYPLGVAVDGSGNVFVGDSGNSAVKEILAAGGYTTVNTLGGSFPLPYDVALDGIGNVFVAELGTVSEILAAGGYSTVDVLATNFTSLTGISVDGSGNVFVADYGANSVQEIDFADPPTLAFASTPVGSTSSDSPQIVTATNVGNATLSIPAPLAFTNPTIGTNFSLNSTGGTACPLLSTISSPATLAAGASCTLTISFVPTTGGSISNSLVLTDTNLNATLSPYATQSLSLDGTGTLITPVISFIIANHTFGDAPFAVSASSASSGAFTYAVVSGPATISGSTVRIIVAGRVVLSATQAANGNYAAGTQNASFIVVTEVPTITFAVANQTFGVAPFAVSASSASSGAFTYAVVSGPATISGTTVTVTGVGTVVLSATQAANGNYAAGTQNVSFTVATEVPTISFAAANQTFGVAPFAVSASSASSGAFTYAVVSGPATISGSTVTLTGAGTVVLSATQAANGNYAAGIQNASFTVAAQVPTITFAVANHTFGDNAFAVSASSTSSGAFTYTVVSGPATISGATVTLTGAGTVVLSATQAANGNYAAGTQNASFTVAAAVPTITFAVANHTFGDNAFAVSASSASSGASTYTVVSGPATISGATVTVTGVGTVVLSATQAANGNYAAGTQNASFTVAAAVPTITFTVANQTFGVAPFAVSASSVSSGAFTYTVVSGPATISGSTVTPTGSGTVVLSATQAANGSYAIGTQNTSFTVAAAVPTITFAIANQTFGNAAFAVSASSVSSGAFTYTVVSGPATISGATVTLTGAGTVVLSATQAGNGSYAIGTQNASFTVAAEVFALAPGSASGSSNVTTSPGGTAIFNLMLTPSAGVTFPHALTFATTGTPPNSVVTFSPAIIAAGSGATAVTLTIQVSSSALARNEKISPNGPVVAAMLGFLLLPMAGMKQMRCRLRQASKSLLLVVAILGSIGVACLSGCGAGSPTPKNYAVLVTVTDTTSGVQSSTTLTLTVD